MFLAKIANFHQIFEKVNFEFVTESICTRNLTHYAQPIREQNFVSSKKYPVHLKYQTLNSDLKVKLLTQITWWIVSDNSYIWENSKLLVGTLQTEKELKYYEIIHYEVFAWLFFPFSSTRPQVTLWFWLCGANRGYSAGGMCHPWIRSFVLIISQQLMSSEGAVLSTLNYDFCVARAIVNDRRLSLTLISRDCAS